MLPRPPLSTPPRSGPSTAGRALAIIVASLLLLIAILFGPTIWTLNQAVMRSIEDWRPFVGGAIVLLLLTLLVGVVGLLYAAVERQIGRARQAAIFKAPSGMPIHVADVRDGKLAARLLESTLNQHYAQLLATAQRATPELHNQSIHIQQLPPPPPPQITDVTPPPQITLAPESTWLAWTDQAPHLMVAGRTDSGKTTTVEAVLARRIQAGDMVLVIDPHYQAGKWLGAAAIGGGRDYAACYQAFDNIRALLDKRYASFNAGTRTEDYRRVTIVVDEVPAIITHAQMTSKALYERWLLFANGLGSEARKVRISIILLTQSPLVRDIGISSAMRENFTRIALGDTAMDLLREDPDPSRKQALLELLRGRPYAAAMEYRNSWYALQNDDIPRLAQTNGTPPRAPSLLIGPPPPAGATPPIPATQRVAPPIRQPAPPTMKQVTVPEMILDLLTARGGYMTASEIAAALKIDLQVARVETSALATAGVLTSRKPSGRRTKERLEYALESTHKPINALTAISA